MTCTSSRPSSVSIRTLRKSEMRTSRSSAATNDGRKRTISPTECARAAIAAMRRGAIEGIVTSATSTLFATATAAISLMLPRTGRPATCRRRGLSSRKPMGVKPYSGTRLSAWAIARPASPAPISSERSAAARGRETGASPCSSIIGVPSRRRRRLRRRGRCRHRSGAGASATTTPDPLLCPFRAAIPRGRRALRGNSADDALG